MALTNKQWVEQAIHEIFMAKDDELFTAFYVRAILEAIGDSYNGSKPLQERDITLITGTIRSNARNQRLTKSQRQARALEEEAEIYSEDQPEDGYA